MPEQISGKGAANNPGVSTEPRVGPSLDDDRSAAIASAKAAVDKAEAQLAAAKQELANAKKGMN
jgi:outer membrane protein TolC